MLMISGHIFMTSAKMTSFVNPSTLICKSDQKIYFPKAWNYDTDRNNM